MTNTITPTINSTIPQVKIPFSHLTDQHGRYYRKLRISILDACNFRCNYCMPDLEANPDDNISFTNNLLSPKEIYQIVENLIEFGTEEVRITGGEPTLRKDMVEIVSMLSKLKLKKLALTTNAFKLKNLLLPLTKTALNKINISLDSLDRDNFKKITGKDGLETVLENILMAKEMGFKIKINCVAMKGINHHELFDFLKFSEDYQIPIRFLEVMKIGVVNQKKDWMISAGEMMKQIKTNYEVERLKDPFDSTSMNYILTNPKTGGSFKVGFIASETVPFCHGCSRLRLTADGSLKACLFKETGINIRGVAFEDYPQILEMLKKMKPISRIESTAEAMYKIGG